MIGPLLGSGPRGDDALPREGGHVEGVQIVQVFASVAAAKDVNGVLIGHVIGRVHIAGSGMSPLHDGLPPGEGSSAVRNVEDVQIGRRQGSRAQPSANNENASVVVVVRVHDEGGGMTVATGWGIARDPNGLKVGIRSTTIIVSTAAGVGGTAMMMVVVMVVVGRGLLQVVAVVVV